MDEASITHYVETTFEGVDGRLWDRRQACATGTGLGLMHQGFHETD
jgi:hypothetical protein